jgi:hypothetical protein
MAEDIRIPRERLPKRPFHRVKPESAPPPPTEMNIVAQAIIVLGTRVSSLREVRLLDGAPCDLDRLMTEANRALAAEGMPQLVRNPAWLR